MKSIQDKMFLEIRNKEIFDQAHKYSLEYLEKSFDRKVYPSKEAINNLSNFDENLPVSSTKAENILEQLNKYGSPATTLTLSGRYFGFVCGSAVPVGLAAKNLGTYWDQVAAMDVTSPICSKLESVVEKWIIDLFNLPQESSVGFVSGTSIANFCALAAARYQLLKNLNWNLAENGLNGAPKLRIIACKQSHSTIIKAVNLLGFGTNSIEWVEMDENGRITKDKIPNLDERTIVILQAGNVNSGSFDEFEAICNEANEKGSWVHIDGAFGLWAETVKDLRHLTSGIQKANSWATDGHKTLNTPYDSGFVICKHREALISALHMSGSYIVNSDKRDGYQLTPEFSRRSRIMEIWATLKYLGKSGIDEMILTMTQRAKQFANEISNVNGFYVENDVVFNQVIVRCESDSITEKVLGNVQMLGECWVGGSIWLGKKIIRISVCSWATTENDISKSVKSFEKALDLTNKREN